MTTFYTKTARYSIAAAALLTLFIAVPTFAAEKNTKQDRHAMPVMTAHAAASTTTDTSNNTGASSSTASTTASSTAVSSNTTIDTSTSSNTESPANTEPASSPAANPFTAVGQAMISVKDKIFAKPVATTATTSTTTSAIATTGIATLFAGPALSGNVYDSNQFGESDTYKMLALALALAAAGLFLTNAEVFSRTYGGISDAITLRPSPQTSRSRA